MSLICSTGTLQDTGVAKVVCAEISARVLYRRQSTNAWYPDFDMNPSFHPGISSHMVMSMLPAPPGAVYPAYESSSHVGLAVRAQLGEVMRGILGDTASTFIEVIDSARQISQDHLARWATQKRAGCEQLAKELHPEPPVSDLVFLESIGGLVVCHLTIHLRILEWKWTNARVPDDRITPTLTALCECLIARVTVLLDTWRWPILTCKCSLGQFHELPCRYYDVAPVDAIVNRARLIRDQHMVFENLRKQMMPAP